MNIRQINIFFKIFRFTTMLVCVFYKICEHEFECKIVFVLILIAVLIFRTISGSHSCWKTLSMIPFWGHWGYNCGLGRSPKWPGSRQKKSSIKNYEINNFWATQTLYVQLKRKLKTIVIYIWNKIKDFYIEKDWKKIDSAIFTHKKM